MLFHKCCQTLGNKWSKNVKSSLWVSKGWATAMSEESVIDWEENTHDCSLAHDWVIPSLRLMNEFQ